jgi:hypothetical protein
MRSIVNHKYLTAGEGIRRDFPRRGGKRKSAVPRLATCAGLVCIPARKVPRRKGPAEDCATCGPIEQTIALGPAPENGKPANASFRSLEREWLLRHESEYAGAWVALQGSMLVAQGSSAVQVLDAARSVGCEQPLVVHIPSEPQLPFGGW